MPYPCTQQGYPFLGLVLAVGMACAGLSGCAWVRNVAYRRTEQCEQLCQEARLAQESGRSDDAKRLLDAARRRHSDDFDARITVADLSWTGGDRQRAIREYQALWADYPHDKSLGLTLARRQLELKEVEQARQTLTELRKHCDSCVEVHLIEARIAEEEGKFDTALTSYHKVLQSNPGHVEANLATAEIYLLQSKPDLAGTMLRSLIREGHLPPAERARATRLLGAAYTRQERFEEVVDLIDPIVAAERTADMWHLLARAHLQLGDGEKARQELQEALRVDPRHGESQSLLATLPNNPSGIQQVGFDVRNDARK